MAGLVAPFLEMANRVTSVAVVTHDRTLARMRFTPEQSPYRFVAMVPQNVTERLLVEWAVKEEPLNTKRPSFRLPSMTTV